MDAQFWIYIVIGVIYFLSRLLKKPEQAPGDTPDSLPTETRRRPQSQQPVSEAPRQLTFEELLREITEGKQAQRRVPEPDVIVSPGESYEKKLGDEARSLEEIDFNEAEIARKWKSYEEVPVRSVERKSLEETMTLEDTVMDFRKFEAFQQKSQRKVLEGYIKIIRNPESLKQAVVMSEILKRKF